MCPLKDARFHYHPYEKEEGASGIKQMMMMTTTTKEVWALVKTMMTLPPVIRMNHLVSRLDLESTDQLSVVTTKKNKNKALTVKKIVLVLLRKIKRTTKRIMTLVWIHNQTRMTIRLVLEKICTHLTNHQKLTARQRMKMKDQLVITKTLSLEVRLHPLHGVLQTMPLPLLQQIKDGVPTAEKTISLEPQHLKKNKTKNNFLNLVQNPSPTARRMTPTIHAKLVRARNFLLDRAMRLDLSIWGKKMSMKKILTLDRLQTTKFLTTTATLVNLSLKIK